MLHHEEAHEQLTAEEIKFNDAMKRGNDFFKIGLFGQAKDCYLEAAEINMENKDMLDSMDKVNAAIKSRNKTIIIIVIVAAVLSLAAYFIF